MMILLSIVCLMVIPDLHIRKKGKESYEEIKNNNHFNDLSGFNPVLSGIVSIKPTPLHNESINSHSGMKHNGN
jgi:hypothetical protein